MDVMNYFVKKTWTKIDFATYAEMMTKTDAHVMISVIFVINASFATHVIMFSMIVFAIKDVFFVINVLIVTPVIIIRIIYLNMSNVNRFVVYVRVVKIVTIVIVNNNNKIVKPVIII